MQVGDKVRLKGYIEHNSRCYDKGHEFEVIGQDGIRGIDVRDDAGRVIAECRFIEHMFEVIPKSSIDYDNIEDFPI